MAQSREGGFQPDRSSFVRGGETKKRATPDSLTALPETVQSVAANALAERLKETQAQQRLSREANAAKLPPGVVDTGRTTNPSREDYQYTGSADESRPVDKPTLDEKSLTHTERARVIVEQRQRTEQMAADSQKAAEILAELEAMDAAEYTPIGTGELARKYQETPLVQPGKSKESGRKARNEQQKSA